MTRSGTPDCDSHGSAVNPLIVSHLRRENIAPPDTILK